MCVYFVNPISPVLEYAEVSVKKALFSILDHVVIANLTPPPVIDFFFRKLQAIFFPKLQQGKVEETSALIELQMAIRHVDLHGHGLAATRRGYVGRRLLN